MAIAVQYEEESSERPRGAVVRCEESGREADELALSTHHDSKSLIVHAVIIDGRLEQVRVFVNPESVSIPGT